MSEPNEQLVFATCNCQNCGGHIKFDATQIRKGETRTVECPHCHLDTILFVKDGMAEHAKNASHNLTPKNRISNQRKGTATQFELFVLRLTRGLTLTGAGLVIAALAVTCLVFLWTLFPENHPAQSINPVSYDEIAAAIKPEPIRQNPNLSDSTKINTAEAVPTLVANFVVHHTGFKLDTTWMTPNLRKAFLDNLSQVLQTASRRHVSDPQLVQIVSAFQSLWAAKNTPVPEVKPLFSKSKVRFICLNTALGMVAVIIVLCLILVLLAIERNIRLIAERPKATESSPGTG